MVSIDKIPALVFDHKNAVAGEGTLAAKVANHPIGFELLPENLPCGNYRIYTKLFTAASLIKKLYA